MRLTLQWQLLRRMGKKLGVQEDPLLVSVVSGAPFSMPGMMDTVLNLSVTMSPFRGLIKQTGNERFAWDSYRVFVRCSLALLGVSGQLFEETQLLLRRPERALKRYRAGRK